jgi:hypothetical protein
MVIILPCQGRDGGSIPLTRSSKRKSPEGGFLFVWISLGGIEPKGVGERNFPRGGIIQTEGFESAVRHSADEQ